jgi:predicted glycosyltransferase
VQSRSHGDDTGPGSSAAGSGTERFMIYSQDGLGLGHLKRTTSIANEILRLRPRACVLTLSDSPMGGFFESQPNHDYLKLPSIVKAGPGDWRVLNLPLEFERISSLRRELIRSAAAHFDPHVVLVDHMPHGAMGELVPALDEMARSGRTKMVLGLRDVLDSPQVIRERWRIEGAYDAIRRYYDLVLVYGVQDLFDHAVRYNLPTDIAAKLRYCGYVSAAHKARYTRSIRAEYKKRSETPVKLIVGMAGGGADGYRLLRSLLDAVPLLERTRHNFRFVFITGPFMPAAQRQELQAQAVGLPATVRRTVADPFSYMSAADVVVAMAGYNSTMEILRSGTPCIFVPRAGPSSEQKIRVRLLKSRGWVDALDPGRVSASALARAITRAVQRPRRSTGDGPGLDGLRAAVDQLLALLPPGAPNPRLASGTPR